MRILHGSARISIMHSSRSRQRAWLYLLEDCALKALANRFSASSEPCCSSADHSDASSLWFTVH